MKKLLFTLLSAVALTAHGQMVTDQYGIEYEINQAEGTAAMYYVYGNSALDALEELTIDSIAYDGKNYPVTKMYSYCFNYYEEDVTVLPNLKIMNFPELLEMEGYCFYNDGGGVTFFPALKTINFPKLQIMGDYSFYNTGEGVTAFPAVETINLPKLQTMGDFCFRNHNHYYSTFFPAVETLDFPCLQKMGEGSIGFGFDKLSLLQFPLSVEFGGECVTELNGRAHVWPYDGEKIFESINGEWNENFQSFCRIHIPEGMAALIMEKWAVGTIAEVYSPVVISKTNSNYNSLSIPTDAAYASYTQDGTTYVNNYNFNYALDKAACEAPLPAGYTTFRQTADYHYKWYVATDYSDISTREGKLTIQTPAMSTYIDNYGAQGIIPGEGFLLKGPATADTLYVPIHFLNRAYTGTNYFRAGTGAAVAKESDGYRNFYYTDPTGFWECANTVIPTNRAYLALPAHMTANAKQISFVIDDGETTGIVNITGTAANSESDTWHTINGTRLGSRPTTKGIYIHNGRKEVIQ